MKEKIETLLQLGAEQFVHINGSLMKHLSGTQELLIGWDAPTEVCDAGLYHAIYGPDGLGGNLLSLEQRDQVAQTIGNAAESLVYLYCACDKAFVLPQLGRSAPVVFRDRFTGEEYELSARSLTDFCEILAANELDVCSSSADKSLLHSERTRALLQAFLPHVRARAKACLESVLHDAQLAST